MEFDIYREPRDFTAGEAAVASGVSPALQRDWRRRGLLEEGSGGWVRYSLSEVCELAMMKAFSDGGVSVKSAGALARFTADPIHTFLEMLPGVVAFTGEELTPEEQRAFLADHWAEESLSRYIFTPLPDKDRDASGPLADSYRFKSLAEIEEKAGRGWYFGLIFDLKALAEEIHARAELPLVTYRVEKREGRT